MSGGVQGRVCVSRGCTLPGSRGSHPSRPRDTLPDQRHPHSGQTDACENIILPQTSLAGGKVVFAFSFAQCKWTLTGTSQGEKTTQVFRIRSHRPQTKFAKVYVFTPVCQLFCSRGGGFCLSACWDTPHSRQPPPTRSRHIPPWSSYPLGPGTTPAQCMMGDMVNKRVVRILLECNLDE